MIRFVVGPNALQHNRIRGQTAQHARSHTAYAVMASQQPQCMGLGRNCGLGYRCSYKDSWECDKFVVFTLILGQQRNGSRIHICYRECDFFPQKIGSFWYRGIKESTSKIDRVLHNPIFMQNVNNYSKYFLTWNLVTMFSCKSAY